MTDLLGPERDNDGETVDSYRRKRSAKVKVPVQQWKKSRKSSSSRYCEELRR